MISAQFVAKVRAGTKRQTIRPARKHPHKVGEILDLREWKGKPYRSKQRHIIFARVTDYAPITIFPNGFEQDMIFTPRPSDIRRMAIADGFANWGDLRAWFSAHYDLPFRGFLTVWEPLPEMNCRDFEKLRAEKTQPELAL